MAQYSNIGPSDIDLKETLNMLFLLRILVQCFQDVHVYELETSSIEHFFYASECIFKPGTTLLPSHLFPTLCRPERTIHAGHKYNLIRTS